VNVQYIVAGGTRGSAAGSSVQASSALNGADLTGAADTDVRGKDQQTVSIIGDVGSHCSKTGNSSERKSSETSHAEMVSVFLSKVLFQRSGHFITAKRCDQKSVLGSEAQLGKSSSDLGDEILVSEGLGESLRDHDCIS
jgi:hypothetical protein